MHRNPSQAEQILTALHRGESLTPLDALNRFGCMRLGARIFELRQPPLSLPIQDETIDPGNGKRVKRYYFEADYLDAKRAHEAAEDQSQETLAR